MVFVCEVKYRPLRWPYGMLMRTQSYYGALKRTDISL